MAFVAVGMTFRGTFMPISALEIELDRRSSSHGGVYRRGDTIKGNLILNSFEEFECFGIEVALEGIATVAYNSGGIARKKTENSLPYEWASVFVVGFRGNKRLIKVAPSNYTIPFSILIKNVSQLAGSFKGALGGIQHQIAAYVHTISVGSDRHACKNIRFGSYVNLRSMPKTAKPFSFDFHQDNSMFFKKSGFWYSFSLYQTGFIGGEPILFRMRLHNLRGSTVLGLRVSLMKKISYLCDVSTKSKFVTMYMVENTELDTSEKMMIWEDLVTVPENCYPTTIRMIIRHQYFIRVEVQTELNEQYAMKRDIPLVIGTVRENVDTNCEEDLPVGRSLSLMSLASFSGSVPSTPPAYPQLTTRRTSMASLPSQFDDLYATPKC